MNGQKGLLNMENPENKINDGATPSTASTDAANKMTRGIGQHITFEKNPANNWTTVPTKKRPATRSPTNQSTKKLHTSNRFEALSDSDMEVGSESEAEEIEENRRPRPINVTKKVPPPIVIHGIVNDHKAFVHDLEKKITKGFYIKMTRNNTNIFVKNFDEWQSMKDVLIGEQTPFHSYTPKSEKKHAFVLNGLHCTHTDETKADTTPDDIKLELQQKYNLKIANVYRMRTTRNPLFMVVTSHDTSLKQLDDKVKYLMYTRISWERVHNRKRMIQCHRCQQWGHATANCGAYIKCLKCAEKHWTKDCEKDRDTPATCANCGGSHTANHLECPEYVRKTAYIDRRKADNIKPAPRVYRPAPPPTRNAWTARGTTDPTTTSSPSTSNLPSQEIRTDNCTYSENNTNTHYSTSRHTTTPKEANNTQTHSDTFTELISEMTQLNSLVNLRNLLTVTRDLNNLMKQCTTSASKFTTYQNFIQSIEKYHI